MESTRIYDDIAKRTGGDIYIGVVGPVRTGKSTFIKRFMETLVIPNIEDVYRRERARDELPQSGSGRTIMTAEPKFVPEDSIHIELEGSASFNVRLIDSVGYMVKGAMGQFENDAPRMVMTPWFATEIPLTEAAELGTRKVIAEHSTIGIVITTDGSITDIPREDYIEPEDRVIRELRDVGKPFLILVNSTYPNSEKAKSVCDELAEKYHVTSMAVDCTDLDENDIAAILRGVLFEFPVSELGIFLPPWVEALPFTHQIKSGLFSVMRESTQSMHRVRDISDAVASMKSNPNISGAYIDAIDLGVGRAIANIELPRELFYKTLGEQSGFEITDDGDLISLLSGLSRVKSEYDKVAAALEDVRSGGYGIVLPGADELTLERPEIVKQGGRYGVRLRASAPSIHLIRADIETEVLTYNMTLFLEREKSATNYDVEYLLCV